MRRKKGPPATIQKKSRAPLRESNVRHPFFGCIPAQWTVKRIGDIAEIDPESLSNITPKNYRFKYISLSDVDGESSDPRFRYVEFKNAPSRARKIVRKGDILFSTVRTNLQGFVMIRSGTKDLVASTGFAVIRPRKCHNEYLFQFLFSRAISLQVNSIMVGSNYPAINSSDVKSLLICLPSIQEQVGIAEILATWDRMIETTQSIIAYKELRRKALMQQLLIGKRRLPGFKKQWREVRLGDIFTERNETGREDLPLLSITGDRGVIPQSESDKRDNSTNDKSKYKRIAAGDIGYNTMRMWQGRSALSSIEGIVSPAYTILIPRDSSNGKFFSYLFKTPKLIHLFFRNSQGLVEDTLNCRFNDFASVKVHIPEFDEQSAIAKFLEQAETEGQLLKRKLSALQEQKKGLMEKLLTGKVRVVKHNSRHP